MQGTDFLDKGLEYTIIQVVFGEKIGNSGMIGKNYRYRFRNTSLKAEIEDRVNTI